MEHKTFERSILLHNILFQVVYAFDHDNDCVALLSASVAGTDLLAALSTEWVSALQDLTWGEHKVEHAFRRLEQELADMEAYSI